MLGFQTYEFQLHCADDAVSFAAYLVKTCVIEEAGVTSTEFYNVIEALGKVSFSLAFSLPELTCRFLLEFNRDLC